MNVIEVNYTDLPGRIFSGFDLHLSLNQIPGVHALQYVLDKYSTEETVRQFRTDPVLRQQLLYLENKYSVNQLLGPCGRQLLREEDFQKADVVHLHILHNNAISILDLPEIMARDNVVWTIHDPWIVTGNCIHPLECGQWLTGCGSCMNLQIPGREMHTDNTGKMWELKKRVFSQMNPYIVVPSTFMEGYLRKSPLTAHWNRIFRIPFGIKETFLQDFNREKSMTRFGIPKDRFVIGFRLAQSDIKGCGYIFEALEQIKHTVPICLFAVGGEGHGIPENLKKRFEFVETKWLREEDMIHFYRCLDVFLMPSLAESFGMMALEAMACETAVICFESTVVEEITQAPDYGVAVEYRSSAGIAAALERLLADKEELSERKRKGKEHVRKQYSYEDYVRRHFQLYREMQANVSNG